MASKTLKSPTGGVVSIVHKAPGDSIDIDEEILVIECMKMEIPVAASDAGRLVQINVKVGEAVAEDQVIAVIET